MCARSPGQQRSSPGLSSKLDRASDQPFRTNRQVTAAEGTDEPTLLCLFYSAIFAGVGTGLDYFQTDVLLGADAPPGVIAGLDALEADPADADALASVDGYLGPICAQYLD